MNKRAFSLALVMAFLSMMIVYTYIEDEKSKLVQEYGQKTSVVVAKEDINEYELLDETKLTVKSIPKDFRAPGHFKTIAELDNTIAIVPIRKGEQITQPRITYPGKQTGLAGEISAGKRAFALAVDDQNAVSKLIKPGDRVDVLAAIDYGDGRLDQSKIKTVLQDVRVLSTGMSVSNNLPILGVETPREIKKMKLDTYTNYNTITLELDPFEVQKMLFLKTYMGRPVFLTLRNNTDSEKLRIQSTRLFDILGEDSTEAKTYFTERYSKGGR